MKKYPAEFPFFPTLLPSNYGRKEENMFTMLSHSLSRSLRKLTAHHKSISAWRKSISRLPLLPQQKTYLILLKKKKKKKKSSRAPVRRRRRKRRGEGKEEQEH